MRPLTGVGCFPIHIYKPYQKRKAICGFIMFHDKIMDFLTAGAIIKSLSLKAGDAPANKLRVTVTLYGRVRWFLIGFIDVNRKTAEALSQVC